MQASNQAQNYTAIIVDHDKNYRKSLASIIKQHFKIREIYSCSTAREAMGVGKQINKLDFLFFDSEISDQPVLSLVNEIKQLKSSENAKVTLLSTSSNREFLLEAAAQGVNAVILKPFTPKTVTEKISKLINGKSQRKTKRIKVFNTVGAAVAFKSAKYQGELDDISSGGCMITLPPLANGGTIFDLGAIRINYEELSVDIKAELIRLERDMSSNENRVKAAFIFKDMEPDTQQKFSQLCKALDKSQEKPS